MVLKKSVECILRQTLPKLSAREQRLLNASQPLPASNAPAVLILTALRQSQRNLLLPLRQTTERFLCSPRTGVEYNLYLQSISHIPFRTPESTRTVKCVLGHVDGLERPIGITTRTYTRLIRPWFTPVALLVYLHDRLGDRDLPLPILVSFLTVYSKLSDPTKAGVFYADIQAHPDTSAQTLQHASTLLLAAQNSQQAAYDVLISPDAPSTHPYASSASLHVLSKDLSIPPQKLIQTFLLLTSSSNDPPLLLLYTSLINGLVLRKKHSTASVFFSKLLKLNVKMDAPSLSAGISALTRAGNPHEAFQLLETHYPALLSSPLPLLSLLTALNRISRPDLTTLFFFLYPTLYPSAPPPNPHMLNLLLQAGRMGIKMDSSMQTDVPENLKRLVQYLHSRSKSTKSTRNPKSLLTKLNLRTSTLIHQITSSLGKNLDFQHLISKPLPPFGRQFPTDPDTAHPHPHPRLHASNLILTHLGHPSRGGLRHFLSSAAYQRLPSATWARVVFLRVLAGVGAGLSMSDVHPPATSFVSPRTVHSEHSPSLDSFTHLFSHHPKRSPAQYSPTHFQNPRLWERLLAPAATKTPFYPSVVPTNSNFFNYLLLLALTRPSSALAPIKLLADGRVLPAPSPSSNGEEDPVLPVPSAHETPLVLAWMQTLQIQPSSSTLAIALVLWGEVCASVDADPCEGALKRGEGQYLALVDHLRAWVGEGRLPHWRTLEKWRGVLARVRAGGAVGVFGEDSSL